MKLAQRVGVASALLAVLAFANASNFGANAEGVVSETTVNLTLDGSVVKDATAVLTRLETGVSMKLNTLQLEPGHAYTVWWVVSGSFVRADGHVVDSDGAARFEASLLKTSDGLLQNPMAADIRLTVRKHALAIPGKIDAMIYTHDGGCPCHNVQRAVFKPPASAIARDPENGRIVFQISCAKCHTTEAGVPHGRGPNLHGIFGRQIASVDFPRFSRTFKELNFAWDEERLSGYIANPRQNLPGTIMRSPGVHDSAELADLIAYLKEATAAE